MIKDWWVLWRECPLGQKQANKGDKFRGYSKSLQRVVGTVHFALGKLAAASSFLACYCHLCVHFYSPTWGRLCFDFWVDQKVHSCFSITSYRKTTWAFWPTLHADPSPKHGVPVHWLKWPTPCQWCLSRVHTSVSRAQPKVRDGVSTQHVFVTCVHSVSMCFCDDFRASRGVSDSRPGWHPVWEYGLWSSCLGSHHGSPDQWISDLGHII